MNKKKKPETLHLTAPVDMLPERVFDVVFDIFKFRPESITKEYIDNLGKLSLHSALNNPEDVTLLGFFIELGYGTASLERWKSRSEEFKAAYEARRRIIGNKRESGAILKKSKKFPALDTAVLRSGVMYEDNSNIETLKGLHEWESSVAKQNAPSSNITIEVPEFPRRKDNDAGKKSSYNSKDTEKQDSKS